MLIMAEFSDFSPHLFDDSEFQMESSARFPETDATDLLEIPLIMQSIVVIMCMMTQYCHHERTD